MTDGSVSTQEGCRLDRHPPTHSSRRPCRGTTTHWLTWSLPLLDVGLPTSEVEDENITDAARLHCDGKHLGL